ncbi:Gfo/Idh/MocA family protein [Singulisphaera sp. PoT]|uniref:Gfo/Idh/MocA family protein n=1 Tax=Singulisphaera sp. PoT TaxID=3411797 RepID=UPI003BF499A2
MDGDQIRTAASRRTFLLSAGALALAGRATRGAEEPSERVGVAIIGLRSRGTDLAREFAKNKGADVLALCDIDDAMFAKPLKEVESIAGKKPRVEKDFRRLLDDKSINAIVVAAPDHWHGLLTVLGCQAGKDVYCEKPVSHNVVEGRRMVEAARKYQRVVQAGTQRRSMPHIAEAVSLVKGGTLGKVGMARAWIHQVRPSIGHGKPEAVPQGVDYAMWQGPAPERPFHANRFHYNWHWFWNWGTGELGNNGIHGLDVARWGLGVDAPVAVTSGGGKYIFDDDQEVPDTQAVTWEFPQACLTWEHRMWSKHGNEGSGFGIAFDGEKGTLIIDDAGYRIEQGKEVTTRKPASGSQADHVANFLECIKSRANPNAEIEIGHLSTRLCHLGNIAHRLGRKLKFDGATESFPGDAEANQLLTREYGTRFEMPSQV